MVPKALLAPTLDAEAPSWTPPGPSAPSLYCFNVCSSVQSSQDTTGDQEAGASESTLRPARSQGEAGEPEVPDPDTP